MLSSKTRKKHKKLFASAWSKPASRNWLCISLSISSILLGASCQDRLFDNPFDPQAGQVVFEVLNTIFSPAANPRGLAWDGSTLWVVDGTGNVLISLNRLSGTPIRTLDSPLDQTTGIAYDSHDLWVCSERSVDVYKINLLNGDVQKRLNLQKGSFSALTYAQGSLWLADAQSNKVLQVHPETGELLSSFPNAGIRADGLAFDGLHFWVSDSSRLTIIELAADGSKLRTFISPGQSPRGLAFDGQYLWNVDGNQKIYQLRYQD
jgi:DNA-binding beta-propeller fold protein YncE